MIKLNHAAAAAASAVIVFIACVGAEPPVNSYLPPSSGPASSNPNVYTPSGAAQSPSFGGARNPASEYGAPQRGAGGEPAGQPINSYGPPSTAAGPAQQGPAFSGVTGQVGPSPTGYDAGSRGAGGFEAPPSTSYGPPSSDARGSPQQSGGIGAGRAPSNSYGPPSSDARGSPQQPGGTGAGRAPSNSYGPPSSDARGSPQQSGGIGAGRAPSNSYGPPSSNAQGLPHQSSGIGASRALPSDSYGPPSSDARGSLQQSGGNVQVQAGPAGPRNGGYDARSRGSDGSGGQQERNPVQPNDAYGPPSANGQSGFGRQAPPQQPNGFGARANTQRQPSPARSSPTGSVGLQNIPSTEYGPPPLPVANGRFNGPNDRSQSPSLGGGPKLTVPSTSYGVPDNSAAIGRGQQLPGQGTGAARGQGLAPSTSYGIPSTANQQQQQQGGSVDDRQQPQQQGGQTGYPNGPPSATQKPQPRPGQQEPQRQQGLPSQFGGSTGQQPNGYPNAGAPGGPSFSPDSGAPQLQQQNGYPAGGPQQFGQLGGSNGQQPNGYPNAGAPGGPSFSPDSGSPQLQQQNGYPASDQQGQGQGLAGDRGSNRFGSNAGTTDDSQNNSAAMYEFMYDVEDEASGLAFGHSEKRDGLLTTGQYNVLLPDGRKQIVEYVADQEGYRPKVRYEGEAKPQNDQSAGGQDNTNSGYPSGIPSDTQRSDTSAYPNDSNYQTNDNTSNDGYPGAAPAVAGGYPGGQQSGGYQQDSTTGLTDNRNNGFAAAGSNDQQQPTNGYPDGRPESRGSDGSNAFGGYQQTQQQQGIDNGNTIGRGSGGGQPLIGGDDGYPRGGPTVRGSGY